MAHFGDDRFDVHRDDRLVLDDHDRTGHAICHFAAGNLHQLAGFAFFNTDDLADFFKGEPFDRVQQQRFAAVVGQFGEVLLRLGAGPAFTFFDRRTGAGPDAVQNAEHTRAGVYTIQNRPVRQNRFERCGCKCIAAVLAAGQCARVATQVRKAFTQRIADTWCFGDIRHLLSSF